MKKIFMLLMVLLAVMLAPGRQSYAQEVFPHELNRNGVLYTIAPDYYYPLRYNQTPRDEYIDPQSSRMLQFDGSSATKIQAATSRWFEGGGALRVYNTNPGASLGGLQIPPVLKNEILNNKVLNMSFWFLPSPDVVDPSWKTPGSIFSIASGNNVMPNVSVEIRDMKVVVYIKKGGKLVPMLTTNFPVGWGETTGGDVATNGYIFFCITSTWNFDGNRCRIYIGRPGGRLYCKYLYCSPFDKNRFTASDQLYVGKPVIDSVSTRWRAVRSEGISDLMFYTSDDYALHMMNPEDVLNNFYVQSPLYEGIAYEIGANLSVMGLESRSNAAPLAEEFITLKRQSTGSTSPFGYNRFYIENIPGQGGFMIRNMANGARLDAFHSYMYTRYKGPEKTTFKYVRNTADPGNNFRVSNIQYSLVNFYDPNQRLGVAPGDSKYIWLTSGGTDQWFWNNTAASKVFRGPHRFLNGYTDGKVQLRNQEEGYPGLSVKYASEIPSWDYVGYNFTQPNFNMFASQLSSAYIRNRFETSDLSAAKYKYLSPYYWPNNFGDPQDIILNDYNDAQWELVYVEDGANNKPLYMIREKNDNVAFKMGMVYGDANKRVQQVYKNVLDAEGNVSNRRLWNICKIGGGRTLTEAEKKQVEESKKEIPPTIPVDDNPPAESSYDD